MTKRQSATSTRPALYADKALLGLVARFLVYLAAVFALTVWLGARTNLIIGVQLWTASTATALINATGIVATRTGELITVPGRLLVIGPDCTGLTIAALFACLVIAYPVRVSTKLIGLLVGVAAIIGANLARLVAVAQVATAPDAVFTIAHDFLFQAGMVAVAVALWAAWLWFARSRES